MGIYSTKWHSERIGLDSNSNLGIFDIFANDLDKLWKILECSDMWIFVVSKSKVGEK